MILTARGPEQQSQGVDNVLAFINLALALGKAGRPYCGYGCLTGQGNGQGGREHGQKADQLPGYRKDRQSGTSRAHRPSLGHSRAGSCRAPGCSAYEMLDQLGTEGGVRALLVFGSNLAVSAPRAGHIEKRLDALDFLAVSDFFLSETAERADVVLPSAQWAEEEGTMTNLEGRVLYRRRALAPPPRRSHGSADSLRLAERLGLRRVLPVRAQRRLLPSCAAPPPAAIADYAGITYERIERENGVFWPCPSEDHPGTPRLFLDRFATQTGARAFIPSNIAAHAEQPDREFPLYLTTGRVMAQYQSGTQTRRVPKLMALAPRRVRRDPSGHGKRISNRGWRPGALTTRRGSATMAAQLTPPSGSIPCLSRFTSRRRTRQFLD